MFSQIDGMQIIHGDANIVDDDEIAVPVISIDRL
jgi:hypothetical protein